MYIPHGTRTWVIVCRHTKDTRTKGEIIKRNLSKECAQYLCYTYKQKDIHHNYWAMNYTDF